MVFVGKLWFNFNINIVKLISYYFKINNSLLLIYFNENFGDSLRKCSVANVSIESGKGNIIVNGKTSVEYFQGNPRFLKLICSPLVLLGLEESFDITINAWGGGLNGQADAALWFVFYFIMKWY